MYSKSLSIDCFSLPFQDIKITTLKRVATDTKEKTCAFRIIIIIIIIMHVQAHLVEVANLESHNIIYNYIITSFNPPKARSAEFKEKN